MPAGGAESSELVGDLTAVKLNREQGGEITSSIALTQFVNTRRSRGAMA
jgi:hypothetical protein